MMIQPLGPRVLLKPEVQADKTASGIYIPDSAKEDKKEAIVMAVGTFEDGKPLPIKPGDKVLYGGYSNEEFEFDKDEFLIVEFKDVLAIIK